MIERFRFLTFCAMAVVAMGAIAAQAQSMKWPERPVRVIVPFPAGGTSDVVARLFTPRLSEEYGQSFVVDNRSGAGGTIGAEIAARAAPDGYTVAMVPSSYAAAAALYKLPYDPVKGIAPISMIQIVPFILVVQPSVKAGGQLKGIHRAYARAVRHAEFRLGRHRQHAALSRRIFSATQQFEVHAHPIQRRWPGAGRSPGRADSYQHCYGSVAGTAYQEW